LLLWRLRIIISARVEKDTLSEEIPARVYLDDYDGYSTDLSLKIGAAAELLNQPDTCLSNSAIEHQADDLELAVHSIMQ